MQFSAFLGHYSGKNFFQEYIITLIESDRRSWEDWLNSGGGIFGMYGMVKRSSGPARAITVFLASFAMLADPASKNVALNLSPSDLVVVFSGTAFQGWQSRRRE